MSSPLSIVYSKFIKNGRFSIQRLQKFDLHTLSTYFSLTKRAGILFYIQNTITTLAPYIKI